MSTTPPPEPPTRRLDPTPPPVEAAAPYYERVVEQPVADPSLLVVRLEDAIQSLRTALAFVGVLAVLALGLALYALLADDNNDSGSTRGAASDDRVSNLDDRVDRLSRQVQSARAAARDDGDTTAISDRVDALSRQVQTLRSQAGSATAAPDATQAIGQLDQRIDDLTKRVDDLAQNQTTP
ncbi:MAG TPA: hypothetical protein VMY78_15250 [Solirubrobacteraceae bacterium]|nr:hypothetical protein [Solirubrobacteraceae bacterium]